LDPSFDRGHAREQQGDHRRDEHNDDGTMMAVVSFRQSRLARD